MTRNKKSTFRGEPAPAANRAIDVAPGRGGGFCPAGGTEGPSDGIDMSMNPWESIADLRKPQVRVMLDEGVTM